MKRFLWAIHKGRGYFVPFENYPSHAAWFEDKGWTDYDYTLRGHIRVDKQEKVIDLDIPSSGEGFTPDSVYREFIHKYPSYKSYYTENPGVTDRALRYRANSISPKGKRECAICQSVRNLVVDHIDGFEENTKQSNLRWLCKSCNTGMGIKMKREGKGRRTRQFNPSTKYYVITYAPYNLVKDAGIFIYKDQAVEWAKQANRIDPKYRGRGLKVEQSNEKGQPLAWLKKENPIPAAIIEGAQQAVGWAAGSRAIKEVTKKRKRNFYPFTKDKPFVEIEFRKRESGRVARPIAKSKKISKKSDSVLRVKQLDRDIEGKLKDHYARGGTLKEFLQSNPGSMSKKQAEELSKKWHGREPETETEIEEIENYSENVAELGDLEELGVLAADLQSRFSIFFKKDRPKLCASDEHNLEFIGGDQSLKDVPEGVEREGKQLVPLGYIIQIVYISDKHHLQDSNGTKESYEHFFGEEFYKEEIDSDDYENAYDWFEDCMAEGLVQEAVEDGLIPLLVYNKTDEKLLVVGGKYTVEDVGIRN